MSDESHELVLTITNSLKNYANRLNLANNMHYADRFPVSKQTYATKWLQIVFDAANNHQRQYGKDATIFSVQDLLDAASELASYYETHAKEIRKMAGKEIIDI